MKNLKLLLTTALVASFISCVNDDSYGTPDLSSECIDLQTSTSVDDISLLANSSAQLYDNIDPENPDVLEAIVTSSDEGGNFYKSISLMTVDGTKGFTMPIDAYNLYSKYEPGRKVFVIMDSLYFDYRSQIASLEIGSLYNNDTPDILTDDKVGRISGVKYPNVVKRSCTKIDEEDIVKHMSIADAKNNQYINMLIEFDAVQFANESLGKTYFDPSLNSFGGATNHYIADSDGNTMIVRISEYAKFAGDMIPDGSGKIRGVLTKYNSDYQFMIRTTNDVQLNDTRIVPLFEETFSANWNNWTKFSVTGAQGWVLDTQYGNPGNCAKMSGYASGNQTNEDWLISPAIDLSSISAATLKFDTATKFSGNAIEIYISTNYSGSGAPSAATWSPLSATLSPSTGNYVWTGSGNIDISAYTGGNVYIAFRYTSTTSAAATWEVDNIKIQ